VKKIILFIITFTLSFLISAFYAGEGDLFFSRTQNCGNYFFYFYEESFEMNVGEKLDVSLLDYKTNLSSFENMCICTSDESVICVNNLEITAVNCGDADLTIKNDANEVLSCLSITVFPTIIDNSGDENSETGDGETGDETGETGDDETGDETGDTGGETGETGDTGGETGETDDDETGETGETGDDETGDDETGETGDDETGDDETGGDTGDSGETGDDETGEETGDDETGDETGEETGDDETGDGETGDDETGYDETGDETGDDETGDDETGSGETGETGDDETGDDETGDETGGETTPTQTTTLKYYIDEKNIFTYNGIVFCSFEILKDDVTFLNFGYTVFDSTNCEIIKENNCYTFSDSGECEITKSNNIINLNYSENSDFSILIYDKDNLKDFIIISFPSAVNNI